MAEQTVHVALDLGSDTIKIAYAYRNGEDFVGKIVGDPLGMTAIPAVAYYDTERSEWLFGDDVDSVGDKPFITVVKICDLLRLLQNTDSAAVQKSNRNYYFKKSHFPKFYFPRRAALTDDMDAAVRTDRTFTAERSTPCKVCERFFEYVYGVVVKRLNILFGAVRFEIVPSVVYPPFSDSEYMTELRRLAEKAFGTHVAAFMSMAKALCAYAKYSDRLKGTDRSLIFNFGEERTSVVKVGFSRAGVSVDGADGHNPPADIGGKDIDYAVASHIDVCMSGRETMGRPSRGQIGHIAETALNSKQYLFLKDIKSAKIVLGMPIYESKAFRCGVPVSSARDLLIQRTITREEFVKCIGITDDCGIARRFVDYIKEELARPVNSDVNKIFITGGPIETYGLVDYIRACLKPLGTEVYTFERDGKECGGENDGFNIMDHEDALYSPALGCAVASLYNMRIDTVLALTYGVRLFRVTGSHRSVPFFKVLVDKGTRIPQDGATYCSPKDSEPGITTGKDSEESAPLQIMSTYYSSEDIAHMRKAPTVTYFKSGNENLLIVDTDNKTLLAKLQENVGLRILNGGSGTQGGSTAKYYYKGVPVVVSDEVYLTIGVNIDKDGYAEAFASNDKKRNRSGSTEIRFLESRSNGNINVTAGMREHVLKKDIEFRFRLETQLT